MESAMGMIEVEGVAGIVLAADAACKAARVDLLGWESIGGFTTVFFQGSVGAVANALESGERAARTVISHVVGASIPRPEPAYRSYVAFPVRPDAPAPVGALGLLETRGYGVHVPTNDAMVKAAGVTVYTVLTVQNRVVCSLLLGTVGAVEEALAVGRARVAGSEYFMGWGLIPHPAPGVFQAFGGG